MVKLFDKSAIVLPDMRVLEKSWLALEAAAQEKSTEPVASGILFWHNNSLYDQKAL